MRSASQTDLPRWLPRASLDVLAAVGAVLGNADWLLVGALARDHAFRDSDDLGRLRATMDVDLAVLVATWDEFAAAFEGLTGNGGFQRTALRHRLRHANGQLLDVLPFGGVEEDGHIAWPPDGEPEMNMLGFADAFRASSRLALPGDLSIRVATPPAVALLKIIAWHDNPAERERDLEDVAAFIRGYVTEILGWDAAFRAHADVMTAADFDLDEAGAQALGRDIAGILSPAVHGRVAEIVDGLAAAESGFAAGMQEYLHVDFGRARRLCARLVLGIREGGRE